MRVTIHETAIVDEGAQIGDGSRVWHFAHVCGGAKIGKNVSLGQNVFVGNCVEIGDNCKVQNNVSVYDGVHLEKHVFCGPSVVFTNVINPRADIEKKSQFCKTHVGEGASIGANATVICGVTIGSYAFVGAGSVVTADIKPHALCYGSPARHKGWVCKCGEKIALLELKGGMCAYCGALQPQIPEAVSGSDPYAS